MKMRKKISRHCKVFTAQKTETKVVLRTKRKKKARDRDSGHVV